MKPLRLLVCLSDFKAVTYAPPIDVIGPEPGRAFFILEGLNGPTPLALQCDYVSQETAEALVRRCPDDWRIVVARVEW